MLMLAKMPAFSNCVPDFTRSLVRKQAVLACFYCLLVKIIANRFCMPCNTPALLVSYYMGVFLAIQLPGKQGRRITF